jgi:predicted O-methyltransferase YrrM
VTSTPLLQRSYVFGARAAARAADRTGLDRWLARRGGPVSFQVRSMLAIYDVERMIPLDVPWWTYKATDEVDQFLARRGGNARVFEYGAGASTLWLARRAAQVCSIDHDPGFVDMLRPLVASMGNVDLRWIRPGPRRSDSTAVSEREGHEHLDFADYAAAITTAGGRFDVIVIDGRARTTCLRAAIPYLNVDGLIVFDNAARSRYRREIRRSGLREDQKVGWAPSLPYREVTSLLHR